MARTVAIATVQVPFINGGAESLAQGLHHALVERGFDAEIVSAPFRWYPPVRILEGMAFWRLMELEEFSGRRIDLVIGLKFPAYLTPHECKTLWILHQHRTAYELWGTEFGDLEHFPEGPRVRDMIRGADCTFIPQARRVYTISKTVAQRLRSFNNIEATPLYHPSPLHNRLFCRNYGDFIFYPSRLNRRKRQDILLRSLSCTKTPVKALLTGIGPEERALQRLARDLRIEDRVVFAGLVSPTDLLEYYAECMAVFFSPYQEDLGYVAFEAMEAGKPVITCDDSGEPALLASSSGGGFVVPNGDPLAIAQILDHLYLDRALCRTVGRTGADYLASLKLSWDTVVEVLTA